MKNKSKLGKITSSKQTMAILVTLVVFVMILFTSVAYYLDAVSIPWLRNATDTRDTSANTAISCYKWDFNNFNHRQVITNLTSPAVGTLNAANVGVTYKHNIKPQGDYPDPFKVLNVMVLDPYANDSTPDLRAGSGKVLVLNGGKHYRVSDVDNENPVYTQGGTFNRDNHDGGDLILTFNNTNVTQIKFDTIDMGDEDEKGRINNNYYTVVSQGKTEKVMLTSGANIHVNNILKDHPPTKDYPAGIQSFTLHFSGSAALDNLEICNQPPLPTLTPPDAGTDLSCKNVKYNLVDYSKRGSKQNLLKKDTHLNFLMETTGQGITRKEVCFSGLLDGNKSTAWKCLREDNNSSNFDNSEINKSISNLNIANVNNITFEEIKNQLTSNSTERAQIEKNGINWGFNVFNSKYKCEGGSGKVIRISDGVVQSFSCLNGNVAFQNTCSSSLHLAPPATNTPIPTPTVRATNTPIPTSTITPPTPPTACIQRETRIFYSGEFVAHNASKRNYKLADIELSEVAKKYDINVQAFWGWTGAKDQKGSGNDRLIQNNERHNVLVRLLDNQSSAIKSASIVCDDLGNTLLYNDGTKPLLKVSLKQAEKVLSKRFLACRNSIDIEKNNGTVDNTRILKPEGKYDRLEVNSILDYTNSSYAACLAENGGNKKSSQKKCAQSHYSRVTVDYCVREK